MKKILIILAVILVLGFLFVAVIGLTMAGNYNHLVALSQAVDSQWAQVQNVYQRRADLIPNLVSTVSGAANFEKSTLTEITQARASVGQVKIDPNTAPTDPAKLAAFDQAQGQLSSALSRLMVVVERYPESDGDRKFPRFAGGTGRHGKPHQRRTPGFQHGGAELRHRHQIISRGLLRAACSIFKTSRISPPRPGAETAPKVQFNFGQPAVRANP